MTDSQLLVLCISIVFPLSMLLYSNSRITDVRHSVGEAKETLRAELGELRVEMRAGDDRLRAEISEMRLEMRAGFERIETAMKGMESRLETKLKIHELEHHK